MADSLKGRDFLKLLDYSSAEIEHLLDVAAKLKAMKKAGVPHRFCEGKNIVLLFEKTSTRTRCSFEVGAYDLGMNVTYLDSAGSQVSKKESIADSARVLSRFYDGIEYRGFGRAGDRRFRRLPRLERPYRRMASHSDDRRHAYHARDLR